MVVWFLLIGAVALVLGRSRPDLRAPMLLTVAILAIASAGVGYLTGFRKSEVNENVAIAEGRLSETDRAAALSGEAPTAPRAKQENRKTKKGGSKPRSPKPAGPAELASGKVSGADGHAATGKATLIAEGDGDRVLTLTDFDVDPGPDVDVYLSTSTDGVDDAINLGGLKGEVGNQQYSVPKGVDLSRYDDLVLWCIPFTTRIATAELR